MKKSLGLWQNSKEIKELGTYQTDIIDQICAK